MTEIWKPIQEYEDRYHISNLGRIKSLSFKQRYLLKTGKEAFRLTKEKILSQQLNNSGYKIVHLYKNNIRTAYTVHSLVANAFLPHKNDTVNHINGDKTDNRVDNLEWCSYTKNLLHAVEHKLNKQAISVINPVTGVIYPSISQAAKACRVSPKTASKWKRI
ncbi:TPA: hypothetical protein I7721_08940 [Vibrio vulnificus]|nr:hypothetical protein [Vibrio vulnificus]